MYVSHLTILSLSLQFCLVQSSASEWTIAAAGDLLGSVVVTNDTRTLALWNITQSAIAAFFNMEGQLFRDDEFPGYPASENGGDNGWGGLGGGPTYDPDQAKLLSQFGFNLASHANNHAWDYELAGMEATHQSLAAANIAFAGSGHSLSEARAASYITKDNIRVSLVCAAGSHTPQSVASDGNITDLLNPRPGVNVLRARPVTVLNDEDFATVEKIAAAQGQVLEDTVTDITLWTGQHPIFSSLWRRGEKTGPPKMEWDVEADDLQGILDSIQTARSESNVTIFSLHAHESESGTDDSTIPLPLNSTVPASYIVNLTRSAVDAGADVVLVHGPHHLRGIEIYQGSPIFYSLGSLTYSLGLNFRGYSLPIEWDDGLIAHTKFANGRPSQVILYPTVHNQLTNDTSLPDRTMPKLAPSAEAQRILAHLQKVSEPFDTIIKIREQDAAMVGVIDL